jgi:hypothetical protein
MAKVRSPNYPALDLATALAAARQAFDKDNRNKMSQAALGKHLGHDSLSGPALGKIGALRAYGLIDGKGDELRITDDAVDSIMAPIGSPERKATITRLAVRPKLFQEIQKHFATTPSLENLKFWLIKRQFAPDAAEKAAKCYLATMRLVIGEGQEYDSSVEEPEQPENPPVTPQPQPPAKPGFALPPAKPGMLQEVFNLDEGPVTLSFPSALSQESYEELKDQLELFLRRAQRRAALVARYRDPEYRAQREAHIKRVIGESEDDEAAN